MRKNYPNGGNHTQECTAFAKLRAQLRIDYKHRNWLVDGTDLRIFKLGHTCAGGLLVIELIVW